MGSVVRYYLGIDPDLRRPSIAVVDSTGAPVAVGVARNLSKEKDRESIPGVVEALQQLPFDINCTAAAVEGQEIYRGRTKNPRSIMLLATAAGACLKWAKDYADILYFPSPQMWKGSVPKQIHQARIYGRLGWAFSQVGGRDAGYCRPEIPDEVPCIGDLKSADWKHIGDALGLAQWAREHWEKGEALNVRKLRSP